MHRQSSIQLRLFLAFAVGLFVSGVAHPRESSKALETAITQVSAAIEADTLENIHKHLQHTVNCLVGEQGKGFDASVGNPCKGMRQSAINAMRGQQPATRLLKHAATLARIGTRLGLVTAAKSLARQVEGLLQEAKQSAY